MNSLGAIACGVGLQDSINPTIFMTCAVFAAASLWLAQSPIRIFWLKVIFVCTYALGFLAFTFGPGQILILRKGFFLAAKVIYAGLSAGAFVLGVIFLREWFLMSRGTKGKVPAPKPAKPFDPNGLAVLMLTVMTAVLLSSLAAIGPINNYILLLGNIALLKGQWPVLIPLITGYITTSLWPLWIMWLLLNLNDRYPSLLKIICASIFFTASSCIILTFK